MAINPFSTLFVEKIFRICFQLASILCPAIMLIQDCSLLQIWIPSIIDRLNNFFSLAMIFVCSKGKLWPTMAKWYGILLTLVESSSMVEKLAPPDLYCSGACPKGTDETKWVEFQTSFVGFLFQRRLPGVVVISKT